MATLEEVLIKGSKVKKSPPMNQKDLYYFYEKEGRYVALSNKDQDISIIREAINKIHVKYHELFGY